MPIHYFSAPSLFFSELVIVTPGSSPAFQRATLLSFSSGHMLARDTAWAQRSLLISDVTSPWLTPACIGNWDRRGGRRKGEEDTDVWGRRLQSSVLGHRFVRPCLTHCAKSQQLKRVGCSSSFMAKTLLWLVPLDVLMFVWRWEACIVRLWTGNLKGKSQLLLFDGRR